MYYIFIKFIVDKLKDFIFDIYLNYILYLYSYSFILLIVLLFYYGHSQQETHLKAIVYEFVFPKGAMEESEVIIMEK